jgi:hypothetical protein
LVGGDTLSVDTCTCWWVVIRVHVVSGDGSGHSVSVGGTCSESVRVVAAALASGGVTRRGHAKRR